MALIGYNEFFFTKIKKYLPKIEQPLMIESQNKYVRLK